MSANTSFATTTSTLTQFIAKQKITNSNITSDLSSTEYPIATNAPLSFLRSDILRSTTISINQATALQSGYISNTDWNIFNGKLTSITPGTNISSTGGINPNVSLSISSQIDMSNNPLTRISSQDFNTNIDIKQAGISRIYTTSGVNSDMTITPQGNLRILTDVSLNGKTLDMGGNGVINGISNENFPTNIDLRQNNVKRIYTRNVNGNMNIDSTGLYLNSDVSFNGNLEINNKDILNVRNQSFNIDININQGITSRIKTNGTTNMTLSAPGYLNITTDVSMNGKSIDMSGGSFKNVRYSDISMNGNTIDMSGGAITRIGNQNFQTNIDIKQAGVSRIYTSGGTDMTIAPSGNLIILSDVSLNGNTLDMGTGGIITAPVKLTLNPIKNVDVLSDVSMNGNTLDMGSGVITATTNLTLDPVGNVNLVGNTLNMGSGNIIDVSGIYGVSNKNMRIDASSVTFTNNAITHMVIDNCGIILNDISYGNTGTVLSFNTTNNRVHYYPLYESSFNVMNIFLGNGGTTHNFNLKIKKVADTVTLNIPDASCICALAGAKIGFSSRIDAKYRPSSNINFPAIIYQDTTYSIGKFQVLADGSMNLYKNLDESAGWTDTTNPSGMPGQCFTYTV
jgi:hypothetical protein